jgi:hypothetical protein
MLEQQLQTQKLEALHFRHPGGLCVDSKSKIPILHGINVDCDIMYPILPGKNYPFTPSFMQSSRFHPLPLIELTNSPLNWIAMYPVNYFDWERRTPNPTLDIYLEFHAANYSNSLANLNRARLFRRDLMRFESMGAITGAAHSGKTTLLGLIDALFEEVVCASADPIYPLDLDIARKNAELVLIKYGIKSAQIPDEKTLYKILKEIAELSLRDPNYRSVVSYDDTIIRTDHPHYKSEKKSSWFMNRPDRNIVFSVQLCRNYSGTLARVCRRVDEYCSDHRHTPRIVLLDIGGFGLMKKDFYGEEEALRPLFDHELSMVIESDFVYCLSDPTLEKNPWLNVMSGFNTDFTILGGKDSPFALVERLREMTK